MVVVFSADHRGESFARFVRSVDAAAVHSRGLGARLFPEAEPPVPVTVVVQAIPSSPLNQSLWREQLQATALLELGIPDQAKRLSPTGFLRTIVSGEAALGEPLDSLLRPSALVLWVGGDGVEVTLPIDVFGSLEQHALPGQQVYCPAPAEDGGDEGGPRAQSATASVIGGGLEDLRAAVAAEGMEHWTASAAWVGSEAWALLRTLSRRLGLRIARPPEPALRVSAMASGVRPSWWSVAARSGLCESGSDGLHHPALLSRATLRGVPYHGGFPAKPPATDEQVSLALIRQLAEESSASDGEGHSHCDLQATHNRSLLADGTGSWLGAAPREANSASEMRPAASGCSRALNWC